MASPCTSCGLDVIEGALTLNLGQQTCADIDEVFCGPGGVLSVPRDMCSMPSDIQAQDYVVGVTLNPGDTYITPNNEISTQVVPPNPSTCQIFATDVYIDYTNTIIAVSADLLQCLPIDCVPPPPPPCSATVEIHYEWRIDGGAWTPLFSDFISTGGITGTNHHQNFVLQLDSPAGDISHTYDFRVRFFSPLTSCGTIRLENSTILTRKRSVRITPC